LSSTSSTEQNPRVRSATEVLASRYRHLFVLPSYPTLLVYGGVASFIISVLSRGLSGVVSSIPAFVVLILSATAISSALRILDPGTIATFRRAQALLLGADLLWLMIAAIGAAYALPFGSPSSLTKAILFGGFVCAGFEYLVIHGAFQKNAPLSFVLAVLHPTSTILVIRLSEVAKHFDPVAASAGVAALALMVAFPLLLRRRKTSLGHDALSLFQAFMKTWAAGNSDELEKIISDHAEDVEVTTKVLRFRTKARDAFVVLPGVHPGPFHPVGSYDLPGVVSRELKELGPVMTLHRPGGHERNLATRAETSRYVVEVGELARSTVPDDTKSFLRGPVHSKVDKATVSASAFDDDLVMTISFAPYGSDDIDTSVESELTGPASERGFELSVVDAHNSIDTNLESPVVADQGWKRIFEAMKKERADRFSVAYAHSSEVGFVGRGDLTENGVSLLLFQKQNEKSALLEVLDPEQNNAFSDHYLDVPYDLSKVMFIATGNQLDPIPPPLKDRMEVIELPGYTFDEKVHIAKNHLIPKQVKEHGLSVENIELTDAALNKIIGSYTREAGVRNLERTIADVCRAVAVDVAKGSSTKRSITPEDLDIIVGPEKFYSETAERTELPGVATGLAWTQAGGDLLFIECTRMQGKGGITLTGQLGDVMKESCQAALSYTRNKAQKLGIDPRFLEKSDIHIHFPAGAIPKDGPSAGVTIFTALVSLLTSVRVRGDVAMTGEATLRGLVLPVGGIK
jgi:predicted neutral ceramidase superfamily lipid hydrolase